MPKNDPFMQVADAEEKAKRSIEVFKKKLHDDTDAQKKALEKELEEKFTTAREVKREELKAEKLNMKKALTDASDDKKAACENVKTSASGNMKDAATIITDAFFSLVK